MGELRLRWDRPHCMSNSFHRRWILTVGTLALAILVFAGCTPLIDQDQTAASSSPTVTLRDGVTVGQTFVAHHGGLNGIELFLRGTSGTEVLVTARLRHDPASAVDLAVSSLVIPADHAAGFYRFTFPALADSYNRYLYVVFEAEAGGVAELGVGPGSSYLNGSLYVNGEPVDGQARFHTCYDKALALREFSLALLETLRLAGTALLVWVIPGWALLSLGIPARNWNNLEFFEKLALASGAGVAFYPVLMLWMRTLGVRPGAAVFWVPFAFAGVFLLWRFLKGRGRKVAADRGPGRGSVWPSVVLAAAVAVIFTTRLLAIRSIDAPLWGDSVQHAAMTQLMLDQGGLFTNWLPYAPYKSLTVQFGFASNAAVLAHVLNMTGTQASLVAGQMLSALAVIVLYPFAMRVTAGNRWAAVITIIVAGLLSPMPAFYVNWGRYAQVTGQVVLPVALWLLWESVLDRKVSPTAVACAGLVLTGMTLSYYRMLYYYAAFASVWLFFCAASRWRGAWRQWTQGLARLLAIALVAFVLMSPWISRILGSSLAEGFESGMTRVIPTAAVLLDYQQWGAITDYVPAPLLAAAAVALIWAVRRRDWQVFMLGPWVVVMASLVAGRLINLPGATLLQSFAVMILLYIPLAVLIGWLGGEIVDWVSKRFGQAGLIVSVATLFVLMGVAIPAQLNMIRPEYAIVTRPDIQAMDWIEENSANDAVFLAEGFRVYGGTSAVGADAGWWIPLLGLRANTMPPQYALLNEEPIEADYSRRVVDLVATLETNQPASPVALRALCQADVTHVYIGQTQGGTGFGVKQLFAPEDFLAASSFTLVYHKDRVYIFALTHEAC